MRKGILKGYVSGMAVILLNVPIIDGMTVQQFHELRCNCIRENLKEFDRFETELR